MEPLHQGDILKIEKIKHPVLDSISEIMNISDAIQGIFEYL